LKSLLAGLATVALAGQSVPVGSICTAIRTGEPAMADHLSAQQLGAVSFANSSKAEVQSDFNRGVALLHSFWLDEAEKVFREVASADPDCAMAGWGIAMADFNR
jgi:hypothetical protein